MRTQTEDQEHSRPPSQQPAPIASLATSLSSANTPLPSGTASTLYANPLAQNLSHSLGTCKTAGTLLIWISIPSMAQLPSKVKRLISLCNRNRRSTILICIIRMLSGVLILRSVWMTKRVQLRAPRGDITRIEWSHLLIQRRRVQMIQWNIEEVHSLYRQNLEYIL